MPEGYRIRVRLGGEEFLLKTKVQSPYLQAAVARVERDYAELTRRHPSLPRHRVALLIALNLAHELEKAEASSQPPLGGRL